MTNQHQGTFQNSKLENSLLQENTNKKDKTKRFSCSSTHRHSSRNSSHATSRSTLLRPSRVSSLRLFLLLLAIPLHICALHFSDDVRVLLGILNALYGGENSWLQSTIYTSTVTPAQILGNCFHTDGYKT